MYDPDCAVLAEGAGRLIESVRRADGLIVSTPALSWRRLWSSQECLRLPRGARRRAKSIPSQQSGGLHRFCVGMAGRLRDPDVAPVDHPRAARVADTARGGHQFDDDAVRRGTGRWPIRSSAASSKRWGPRSSPSPARSVRSPKRCAKHPRRDFANDGLRGRYRQSGRKPLPEPAKPIRRSRPPEARTEPCSTQKGSGYIAPWRKQGPSRLPQAGCT